MILSLIVPMNLLAPLRGPVVPVLSVIALPIAVTPAMIVLYLSAAVTPAAGLVSAPDFLILQGKKELIRLIFPKQGAPCWLRQSSISKEHL